MYNRNAKSFKIWNCNNCSFKVDSYQADTKAMAIRILNNDYYEIEGRCTIFIKEFEYCKGIVTIKNYSENKGMTEFLKNLGVIKK